MAVVFYRAGLGLFPLGVLLLVPRAAPKRGRFPRARRMLEYCAHTHPRSARRVSAGAWASCGVSESQDSKYETPRVFFGVCVCVPPWDNQEAGLAMAMYTSKCDPSWFRADILCDLCTLSHDHLSTLCDLSTLSTLSTPSTLCNLSYWSHPSPLHQELA